MRVLLATPSSAARLHNLVPLAWALRAAGHDVQAGCRPGFAATVNRTGLVAVGAGANAAPDTGDWLADAAAVDALVRFAALWEPDLVVWDQRAPAGAVAARTCGAASVRMRGIDDHTAAGADEVERRLGNGPTRHGVLVDRTLTAGDLTLDTTPMSMRAAGGGGSLPVRHVPYGGPAIVPSWLRRPPRRPRVYVAIAHAVHAVADVFDAVAGLDVDAVCAVPVDRIPPGVTVADNVRLVESIPPHVVLPTCAAVVHDGGLGATAAAYGLPQLVLRRGEGALADLIHGLVSDPEQRERARRLADEVRAMPGPPEVVPALVALARR
jgi:glycosyltransferase DesVII